MVRGLIIYHGFNKYITSFSLISSNLKLQTYELFEKPWVIWHVWTGRDEYIISQYKTSSDMFLFQTIIMQVFVMAQLYRLKQTTRLSSRHLLIYLSVFNECVNFLSFSHTINFSGLMEFFFCSFVINSQKDSWWVKQPQFVFPFHRCFLILSVCLVDMWFTKEKPCLFLRLMSIQRQFVWQGYA